MNRSTTFFLFAVPSFLSGFGRVLDLGGAFDSYNISPTPEIADSRAIFADWLVVGEDLRKTTEFVVGGERGSRQATFRPE